MSRVEDEKGIEVTEHIWNIRAAKTVGSPWLHTTHYKVEVLECTRCGMVRTRNDDIKGNCWFRAGKDMPKFGKPPNCSETRMREALR